MLNKNLLGVGKKIIGALSKEKLDQRENLFHARCKIQEKVFYLIIDSGRCINMVSNSLVEHIKIPTRKNSNPNKL